MSVVERAGIMEGEKCRDRVKDLEIRGTRRAKHLDKRALL